MLQMSPGVYVDMKFIHEVEGSRVELRTLSPRHRVGQQCLTVQVIVRE